MPRTILRACYLTQGCSTDVYGSLTLSLSAGVLLDTGLFYRHIWKFDTLPFYYTILAPSVNYIHQCDVMFPLVYGHSIDDDVGAVMLLGRTGTCTRKNGPGDSIVTGGTRFSIERFIVNSDGFSEAPKFKVTLIDCPGLADTTNVVSEQQDYLRMIGDNKKVNTFCFWLKAGDDVSLIEKLRKCISLDHQTSVALVVSTNFHKMKEPNEDKFPHKGTAVQDEGLHIQVNPSACSKCVGTFKHIMSFTFVHNSENFSNVIPYEELTCHPHFVSTWQSPRPIFEIENCGGCIKVISEYEKKD